MLTATDIVLKMLLPLMAGISVALIFRMTKRPAVVAFGRSCGVLTALLLGYFAHFALLNFAFAVGETFSQKVTLTLSQTTSQIFNPLTAIQWLPIIATLCLAVTLLVTKLQFSSTPINHDNQAQNAPNSQRPSNFQIVFIFGALVVLVAGTIVRLLWSSVYFTDRYTLLSQIGHTSIPATLVGLIWLGGFRQGFHKHSSSRWTVASTLLLSISATMLLATSGSFTFALLQMPVIAAALVGFAFFYSSTERSPANHDGWLITSGIILPVMLGFFLAEVHWGNAALFAISAAMVTWFPPKTIDSKFRKFGITLFVCLPAIAAAIGAAIEFSQAVKSPYG